MNRRALMVRKKKIHTLFAEALEEHFLRIELRTEAGTYPSFELNLYSIFVVFIISFLSLCYKLSYIKEFIHGDLGRTTPSLGKLVGCDADILELDVLDVELAWPPED